MQGSRLAMQGMVPCTLVVGATLLVTSALCKVTARAKPRRPLSMSARPLPSEVRFGKFAIPNSQLFFESESTLTFALVNLRPIVPGHVLVCPRRVVPRIADLTDDELCDLWRSVREVAAKVERHYSAAASNIAVQDGRAAGQTVPHVHVHILPRAPGDFVENDEVYERLEQFDGRPERPRLVVPSDDQRVDRTPAQMEAEALALRALWP